MFWLLALSAFATAPDKFGIGARWQGAGAGGVSVVDDGTAALVNPAGLSRVRRPKLAVGLSTGFFNFDKIPDLYWDTNRDGMVDTRDDPLVYDAPQDPAAGIQLQMARHIGGKVGVGFTAYVPTRGLIRFATFEPDLPTYFMYNNRPHRYVAALGVAGDLWKTGISVGAGIDVLAKARLDLRIGIDATITGPEDDDATADDLITRVVADVHQLELQLVPAFAPVIGIQWHLGEVFDPLEGLRLGASYHGAAGLRINADLDMQANLSAEDIGELEPFVTSIILGTALNLADHYTPAKLMVGASYERGDTLTVYTDVRWTDWRAMLLNITHVDGVTIDAPFIDIGDDVVVDGNNVNVTLRSVVGFRTGTELALPRIESNGKPWRYVRFTARGGFGVEPTPLVSQGDSALLDADRFLFTLGLGVEHWDPFELNDGPMRYDLFAQYHTLVKGVLPRDSGEETIAGYPQDFTGIPYGGTILVVGGQFGFDY
jgi:hypothetical protein